jgi:hypothetical protein
MIKQLLFSSLLILNSFCYAQYKYIPVFNGTSGLENLRPLLTNAFKPLVVFDYGTARDTLFFRVFRKNDSLECFYSSYDLDLPNGVDPTAYVYKGGQANGINTEHAYPQSKGAVGAAKSDMNILYPVKVPVNEARGNLPYGDIPDNQTQIWFLDNKALTTIPSVNKDLYSELSSNAFEPRESVKGDVARAIFYFYTMYKEEADAADPNFFEGQKNTLCQWNSLDPVDEFEWNRNTIIGSYQSNRVNPFIWDCTLPNRTYCPSYPVNCNISLATSDKVTKLQMFPNPAEQIITVQLPQAQSGDLLIVVDLYGREIITQEAVSGNNEIPLLNLVSGMYIVNYISTKGISGIDYLIKL